MLEGREDAKPERHRGQQQREAHEAADGGFYHSSVITLLAPGGVVLARDEAIGGPHTALLRSLQSARAAPSR